MSRNVILSPEHTALVTRGRGLVEQKILREYECKCVLHELRLDQDATDETLRLAEEALAHAELMVAAAFMEFALDVRQMVRDEIGLAQEEVPGVPHSVRLSA